MESKETSDWFIIVDPDYPSGDIRFMPAATGGIVHTFQHQNYNGQGANSKWRDGKLCLATNQGSWGRAQYSGEPKTANQRLKWHLERCFTWLELAAKDNLVENADPFEFPDFPSNSGYRMVFNEDGDSFNKWNGIQQKSGIFFYQALGHVSETYVMTRFDVTPDEDSQQTWGKYINQKIRNESTGAWLMLNQIPIKDPWQIPETFGELADICKKQSIDLIQKILKVYVKTRAKGKGLYAISIGFPVSRYIGAEKELIHWFAFELPKPPKITGHRDNATLWQLELNLLLGNSVKIKWLRTENWNQSQLTNRGRVTERLAEGRILIIGAGAVGSTFAELYARLGCKNITIIDYDIVKAGNLSRHILGLKDVGRNKAEAISDYINGVFPFHNCAFKKNSLEQIIAKDPLFTDNFDVIIDATAEDDVIEILSQILTSKTSNFFSVSIGYNAERLYCYTAFPDEYSKLKEDFKVKIEPFLREDALLIKDNSEIIEGIGCWHPLFPTRIDDVKMLAGTAFKIMENQVANPKEKSLAVIAKQYEANEFVGIKVMKH